MRRRKPDGRVHVTGTTVAERIRAAVEQDLADLLAAAPPDEPEDPVVPTSSKPEPRELIFGVDIFMMPDGSYAAEPPPAYMDADAMARHLYQMMLTEVMKRQQPLPCQHDDRFTADPVPIADLHELRTACDRCPIRGHCAGYANQARPVAGFWAGRDYSHRTNAEHHQILAAHFARATRPRQQEASR